MTIALEVLAAARAVRTSELADALDSLGLQERYQMDPAMRPMFPGIRFAGLAHPMEYDATDRTLEQMTTRSSPSASAPPARTACGGRQVRGARPTRSS